MITATFILIMATHTFVSLYFGWRFVRQQWFSPIRRWNYPALICTILPWGWVIAPARELHWLRRPPTTWLLALGATVGVLAVYIIVRWETQK